MRHVVNLLVGLLCITAALLPPTLAPLRAAHAQERQDPGPAAIFKGLKVGQKVNLEDRGGSLEIHLLNEGAIGSHTVLELGRDHLLVEDIVGISRRWIPVMSIRAVVWTRAPGPR